MMPEAAELPWIAAVPVALLLLAGAGLTLAGSIGLLRLRDFYQRVHAPTIGTSYGMGCILAASMIFFTVLGSRLVLHEIAIALLVVLTTPVTLMTLTRAALHRDRIEKRADIPAELGRDDPDRPALT